MDLGIAPALTGIVLVEARQIPVIPLVERLGPDRLDAALAHLLQDQCAGMLCPLKVGGEGDVESVPLLLQPAAGGPGLGDAELGELRIAPAGEKLLEVPFALAVASEDEQALHQTSILFLGEWCDATESAPAGLVYRPT